MEQQPRERLFVDGREEVLVVYDFKDVITLGGRENKCLIILPEKMSTTAAILERTFRVSSVFCYVLVIHPPHVKLCVAFSLPLLRL